MSNNETNKYFNHCILYFNPYWLAGSMIPVAGIAEKSKFDRIE
ncbi:hypothetical protein PTUN_a1354 [Pseudoalteromonas tunicata]|nr:hypothetical protein PTUN_a1354 [Pseudoalteromonas tunicata]